MKTHSLWGSPPSRYYRFLERVEMEFGTRSLRIGILGCSDGKFVLPAARRGHKVLAIDIDPKALYGGLKNGPAGNVHMEGLVSRLKKEKLSSRVTTLCADFVEFLPQSKLHAVWTSGAINYSYNLKHDIPTLVSRVKEYVVRRGFVYFDYMMPFEPGHYDRANFFKPGELRSYFLERNWAVLHDKAMPVQLEKAHVDMPMDHYHKWGHLLVQRI